MHPVLTGPLPHAIAHRGSRILWPENTMAAFRGAVDLGYLWMETDLHLTADGVLVCIHDDTVDRTTDGHGPVREKTFEELQRLDAGYRFGRGRGRPFRGKGLVVPSLEQVVTALPDVRLVVDLKQDGLAEPLVALADRLDLWHRLIAGSFSDRRLEEVRVLSAGRIATSTGPGQARELWRAAVSGRPVPEGLADAVQVPKWHRLIPVVTPRTVAAFHQAGYQVHVWTVNRVPTMRRLVEMGVDGIITDRPDLLRGLLEGMGRWTGRP